MKLLVRERAPPRERWSRENRLSGSTSGKWKRSMAELMRHRQTKEPETDRPDLNHRATSRLYFFRSEIQTRLTGGRRKVEGLGLERGWAK